MFVKSEIVEHVERGSSRNSLKICGKNKMKHGLDDGNSKSHWLDKRKNY